jgi:predicted RNA methylase
MLAALDVQFEDYTFVDYGAGKGKALLLAGSRPFHRVIGVELAAELCEIARRNIQTYTGPRRAGSIEVVHEDATAFDIPDGPLVLYFYNPFDAEVMEAVITNIRQATAQTMRPVYILYRYARLAELFESWCATRCCTPSYTVFEA